MKVIASKRSLMLSGIDEYLVAWALRIFSLPFMLPLLLFIEIPAIGSGFFLALVAGGLLNAAATIIYMRAIKVSDITITYPMVTFTPLFMLITSPLLVSEFPSLFGIMGIFMIVMGSYVLNIGERATGMLSPFGSLLKENGPRLMLLVAIIWSITANIDKVGVLNSNPLFWIISLNLFEVSCMFSLICFKGAGKAVLIPKNVKALLPVGLFSTLLLMFQMTAITMTLVAYVMSIKRTSAIMTVLLGALFFKERNVRGRLAGAVIMVVGVLFITLL